MMFRGVMVKSSSCVILVMFRTSLFGEGGLVLRESQPDHDGKAYT